MTHVFLSQCCCLDTTLAASNITWPIHIPGFSTAEYVYVSNVQLWSYVVRQFY